MFGYFFACLYAFSLFDFNSALARSVTHNRDCETIFLKYVRITDQRKLCDRRATEALENDREACKATSDKMEQDADQLVGAQKWNLKREASDYYENCMKSVFDNYNRQTDICASTEATAKEALKNGIKRCFTKENLPLLDQVEDENGIGSMDSTP